MKKESLIMTILVALFCLSILLPFVNWSQDEADYDQSLAFNKNKEGIGLLVINGPIATNETSNLIGGRTTSPLAQIDAFREDQKVKALIVRINSPGGTVGASQELYRELKRLKSERNIPIIASIADIGASGAYWTALGADTIMANPGSIVGSIGVILSNFDLTRVPDRYGIDTRTIKSGKYKDMFSSWRDMTLEEKALLQGMSDDVYRQFINVFRVERNLTDEAAKFLADGKIYSGSQAKEVGMIDQLGGLNDAIQWAMSETGLKGKPHIIHKNKPSVNNFLELLDVSAVWSRLFQSAAVSNQPVLY